MESRSLDSSWHSDHAAITARLAEIGVRFERWPIPGNLPAKLDPDDVIAAFRPEIDRLMRRGGLPRGRRGEPAA